jgi:hypothetical protein
MTTVTLLVVNETGFPALSYGDGTGKTKEQVEAAAREKYPHINNPTYRFLWNEEAIAYDRKWSMERQWAALKPIQKWMIETAIPELNDEIKSRNSASQLVVIAENRIKKAGFTDVCGRCGGDGRYAYNTMDGDMCYGCNGKKVAMVKITAANKKAIAEHFKNRPVK